MALRATRKMAATPSSFSSNLTQFQSHPYGGASQFPICNFPARSRRSSGELRYGPFRFRRRLQPRDVAACAIGAFHECIRLGDVGELQRGGVPIERRFREARGDAAEEDGFGE